MEKELGNVIPIGEAPQRPDYNSRNAFGRAVSTAYWGIDERTFADIIPGTEELVETSELQKGLFAREGLTVVNGVALNPQEYEAIVRHPGAFAKAVINKALRANTNEPDLDTRKAKAERAAMHALEGKQPTLQDMRVGLINEEVILRRLSAEARSPGYAHMSEKQMRQLLGYVWVYTFGNMLYVNSLNKDWDSAKLESANLALMQRLLTGPQRQRVGNWRQMLELASKYNRARQGLTGNRLFLVGQRAGKLAARQQINGRT